MPRIYRYAHRKSCPSRATRRLVSSRVAFPTSDTGYATAVLRPRNAIHGTRSTLEILCCCRPHRCRGTELVLVYIVSCLSNQTNLIPFEIIKGYVLTPIPYFTRVPPNVGKPTTGRMSGHLHRMHGAVRTFPSLSTRPTLTHTCTGQERGPKILYS